MTFGGVLLDVGGVFLVPDGALIAPALAAAGVAVGTADFVRAHYQAMAAVDEGEPADDPYLFGYLGALDIDDGERGPALEAFRALAAKPLITLWQHRLGDSVDGMRRLAGLGLPLGIVSNSDGTVEEQLRRHRICQVGAGEGVEVLAITDSGVAGVAKPDPRVFAAAIAAVGLPPSEIAYVGDSVRYDVMGAEAAGMVPIHLDPFRMCRSTHQHRHVRRVAELADDAT